MASDNIEMLYLKERLYEHGDYLVDLLIQTLEKKRIKFSGDLAESIDRKVSVDGRGRPVLSISFLSYGRAIEIRWYKSRNGVKHETEVRQNLWKLQGKKKKNAQWYTRTVMGSINRLMASIANDFSDEERARLKRILETPLEQRLKSN
jgi:hypothetical protein